jgi:phosphatidylinositol alpha-1,6-mannosyltransferase
MDFDLARRTWWRRFLLKRIIWSAKLTIANSHALANEIAAFAKDEKPMVVYPPLSSQLARRRHPERAERVEGSINLLTVCRLVERKGIDRILNILPKLENAHYTIVGDGEDEARLNALTVELGVQDRVTFAGMLDDNALVEAYQSADIFVMPTKITEIDREGFGIVYLEAGHFGLPVVGSDHPGVSEAILDSETGYLVHDDEELLIRLQELIQDPDLRHELGAVGKKRSKQFISTVVFAKFKRIIERYA